MDANKRGYVIEIRLVEAEPDKVFTCTLSGTLLGNWMISNTGGAA